MLTHLAHIVKVEFEHSLQLKLVLKVVYNTCCVANASLLMYCATDQILINVVLQPDGSDIIDVIQCLLDLRLLLWLAIFLLLLARVTVFVLPDKYFRKQGAEAEVVIVINCVVIDLVFQYHE